MGLEADRGGARMLAEHGEALAEGWSLASAGATVAREVA